jgi:hypothetical protein
MKKLLFSITALSAGCTLRVSPFSEYEVAPEPPPRSVLLVKELKAGRVYAEVIYAKEIK